MASEAKEKQLIDKYLIEDEIVENGIFISSDETYEEDDADSYRPVSRKNKKNIK